MEGRELDKIRSGSVRAAIGIYGQKNSEVNQVAKKSQMFVKEKSASKARELYMARSEYGRYKECGRDAVSAMEQAETELRDAKKTVKYLSSLVEESKSRANAQKLYLDTVKMPRELVVESADRYSEYVMVLRELSKSKQDVGKLKLDMCSVLKEKLKLEKEIESYNTKDLSQSSAAEKLRKEIEEVNEEMLLVELAHIEAIKELSAVETERENEQLLFLSKIQETNKKVSELTEEVERSREVEAKLAATLVDVEVLKNELHLIKNGNGSSVNVDGWNYSGEVEKSHQLKIVTDELDTAKKELDNVSKECFDCMSSMDIARNELRHTLEQAAQLKLAEEKIELKVQALNSKLLRAKSKLDTACAAEEKANFIISNLSLTLGKLKKETEEAEMEKVSAKAETERTKVEICKFEGALNSAEERFRGAIDELEAVKSSENATLENLQNLIEKVMIKRGDKSQHKSFITISKFEYEYLTGRAVGAEEIADKKIAAAQAWIDALKASEKELLMQLEMAKREMRQIGIEEEQEKTKATNDLLKDKTGMEEFSEQTQAYGKNLEGRNPRQGYSRRSIKIKRISSQLARIRVSGSPLPRRTL